MSGAMQSLFLPCEIVRVRAIVAPRSAILPLEQLVLDLLATRAKRPPMLRDLVQMFGIGERPTFDLVLPLWNRGLITVDPDGGTISLTRLGATVVERSLRDQDTEGLRWSEERLTVVRELVSGHVLRAPRSVLQRPGYTLPEVVPTSGGRLSDGERAEMLEVVQGMLKPTFARQERRLVDAIPLQVGEGTAPERTVVHLRAVVSESSDDDGSLRFAVYEPRQVPPRVRDDLSAHLIRAAADNPDLSVFKNARRRIPVDAPTAGDALGQLLEQFDVLTDAIGAASEAEASILHGECVECAEQIVERLGSSLGPQEKARVIVGAAPFLDTVRHAVRTAREQVVLVCPFASWDGYEAFASELTAAVQTRGVRVLVLWGIEATPEFQRGILQLAERASSSGRGRVLRSNQPARVHAKVVIRDFDFVAIGSANFLDHDGGSAQIGVTLESPESGRPSPTACELLAWVRSNTPEYQVRHAVSAPAIPTSQTTLPAIPRRPLDLDGSQVESESAMRVWQESWAQFRAALLKVTKQAGRSYRLVYDQEHRVLLRRAIRNARHRLLIASDRLTDGAFDHEIESLLRGRLEDGLPVAIIWRRTSTGARPGELATRLSTLAKDFPERLSIIDTSRPGSQGNHAKVIVWDEECVVSSFNFLAFEGRYDSVRGRHLSREVGAHLVDRSITQQVIDGLREQLGESLAAWEAMALLPEVATVAKAADEASAADKAPVASAGTNDLQLLLARLTAAGADPDSRRTLMRAFFARTKDPARVLDGIVRLDAMNADDIQLATLCALCRPEVRRHPDAAQWLRAAGRRMWQERQFFEAAVLVTAANHKAGHEPGDPSVALTQLAAASGDEGVFSERLANTLIDCADDEVDAIYALGLHTLIRSGWTRVADTLRYDASNTPGAGQRMAHAYLDAWWNRTLAPLPLDVIRRMNRERVGEAARSGLRSAALEAMRQGAQPNRFPSFNPGDRTLQRIFGPEGRLRPLWRAIDSDDPSGARSLLEHLDDHEAIVEDAWRAVRDKRQQLGASAGRNILRLTGDALAAAGKWIEAVPAERVRLPTHEATALTGLHAAVELVWPTFRADPGSPAAVPFGLCASLLQDLRNWEPAHV